MFISAGTTFRSACGKIAWIIVCHSLNPSGDFRPAARCPLVHRGSMPER